MCVFVSRPMNIATYLRKNGDHPKRAVDFLLERDAFRNKIMEIVEDFDEKSYNNNGKPWKSSRILRVKPHVFIFSLFIIFLHFSFSHFFFFFIFRFFFLFFHFFHFLIFFIYSMFVIFFISFIFLISSFFFMFLHFSFLFLFFFFLGCSKSVFFCLNCFLISWNIS